MLVKIKSVANVGLETTGIVVEVDVAEKGFPGFNIVGLASKAVDEARERVKTAIKNSGFDFPAAKITVNLAPADIPKDGAAYDLPIAVGILAASNQIPNVGARSSRPNDDGARSSRPNDDGQENPAPTDIFYGELSLDGSLRHTKGVLLVGLYAKDNAIYVQL